MNAKTSRPAPQRIALQQRVTVIGQSKLSYPHRHGHAGRCGEVIRIFGTRIFVALEPTTTSGRLREWFWVDELEGI